MAKREFERSTDFAWNLNDGSLKITPIHHGERILIESLVVDRLTLEIDDAKELIPILQMFVDTGSIDPDFAGKGEPE